MIRLLVVENQPAIRRGLQMWLGLAPDLTVLDRAGDGLAALWHAAVNRPDVILVHLESVDLNTRLIAAMRRAAPESRVVVLSLHDDAPTRRRVLGAGAAAFVSMHEVTERLLQAIRQAAARPPAEPEHEQRSADLNPAPCRGEPQTL
ncbi:MAG: response regulator transcription factor [Armatimonadota bacterium]|nr:response regulator transcription factor [Armatimonadota bacterium]MDR7452747.1 response regulator transcription factor [Armatimonadota bacterium]MDR7468289.1 response regulator transcription factor [Armatimonadota bacterium]MDR7495026.1 response regulator transcription factor [Armatimonadota bacterium]MDR7500462.1 response regulator transcription factor [Armatimonadota bacterium]